VTVPYQNTGEHERPPTAETPVYAVIQFDGADRRVTEVVVAFENAPAADRFATDSGLADYTVAPIGFHVIPAARKSSRGLPPEPLLRERNR
jgi:hypothetical protein